MGSKGCDDVTVGYWYYVGMHMALCHGPVDFITRIEVNKEAAWVGRSAGGTISIDQPNLFGGKDREGGVVGDVDIDIGRANQPQNLYLQSQLGSVPAYRGVTSAILNQVNIGLNPYMKTWGFRAQRIHIRSDGSTQWYDAKAEIFAYNCIYGKNKPDIKKRAIFIAGDSGRTTQYDVTRRTRQITGVNQAIEYVRGIATAGEYLFSVGVTYYSSTRSTPTFPNCPPRPGCPDPYCVNDSGAKISGTQPWIGYDIAAEDADTIPALNEVDVVATDGLEWSCVMSAAKTFFHGLDEEIPKIVIIVTDGHSNPTACWKPTDDWKCSDPSVVKNSTSIMGFTPCQGIANDFALGAYHNRPPGAEIYAFLNGSGANETYIGLCGFVVDPVIYNDADLLGDAIISKLDDFISSPPNIDNEADVVDMNPAHIIRECLTDASWGMGYPESDMDDSAFTKAADGLYDEQMGISLLWDRQIPLEDFVMEILKHINAVLYVSRLTGKFVLKLIRDDYDINTILELNEDHIVSVTGAKRTAFGELVNSVTVQYWDSCTGNNASITIADQALVSMQGNTINTTVQYPGFTHSEIASKACLRDLRTLSTPLLGCTVYANRYASDLNVGDVFVMRWPDLDINGIIMRVVGMAYGDGRNNTVQIQCAEDVFSYPLVAVADSDPDDPKWEDPITPPVPIVLQTVVESPYYELVQRLGETEVNNELSTDPMLGYVGAAGGQPSNAVNINIYTDSGGGYLKRGSLPFCATAELEYDIAIQQKLFAYADEIDIQHVSVGEHAQIEDELVRIDAIDTLSRLLTVGRGVLDTCVRPHSAGEEIYFWDADHGIDRTTYVDGEIVDVKLLPVTGKGKLSIADATAMQITLMHRAIRPYAPADMKAGGISYPERAESESVEITWSHRDRLQQVDGNLYGDTDGPIGPEANTEYLIQVFDDTDTEVINVPNIVGNTQSVDISALVDGDSYEMHLSATRDGYQSWQENIWAFIVGAYFTAASYDPDTFELKQEVLGVGGETCVHGGMLSPDKDGIYHVIPANTPVWRGFRLASIEMISDSGFDDPNEWLPEACVTISGGKANCSVCGNMFTVKDTSQFKANTTYNFSFDYIKTIGQKIRINVNGVYVFESAFMGSSGTFSGSFVVNVDIPDIYMDAMGQEFTGSIDNFRIWENKVYADNGAGVLLDPLPWMHYQRAMTNFNPNSMHLNEWWTVTASVSYVTGMADDAGNASLVNGTATGQYAAQTISLSIPQNNYLGMITYVKKDTNQSRFPLLQLWAADSTERLVAAYLNTENGEITVRQSVSSSPDYTVESIDVGLWWKIIMRAKNHYSNLTIVTLVILPASTSDISDPDNPVPTTGSIIVGSCEAYNNPSLADLRAVLPIRTVGSSITSDAIVSTWAAANHNDVGKYSLDIDYQGGDVSILSIGGIDVLSVSAGNLLLTDGTNTAQLPIMEGEHHIEADFSGSNLILDLDGVTDTVPYDGSLGSGDISVGADIRRLKKE